VGALWWWW